MPDPSDLPINPPSVTKRIYNAFKQYMGLTASPQFGLSQIIQPTFDLSRLSDQGEIQYNQTTFTWGQTVISSCVADASVGTSLQCPNGFEHIYLQLSVVSCDADAFKLRLEVFVPSPGTRITLFQNTGTATTRQPLNHNTLPIYVPQNGSLILYSDKAGASATYSYLRIQRVFGLGPLVV